MFEVFAIVIMVIAVVVGTQSTGDTYLKFYLSMMVGLVIIIVGGVGTGVLAAVVEMVPAVGALSMAIVPLKGVQVHVHSSVRVCYNSLVDEWELEVDGQYYADTVPTHAICRCDVVHRAGVELRLMGQGW